MPRDARVAVIAVVALFLMAKLTHIQYSLSDENVYYLMGRLVCEGQAPYRDFFLGHFPLRILPPAAVHLLFGANFLAWKLVPILATMTAACFLFAFMLRRVTPLAALVTATCFLCSHSGLSSSGYLLGTELAMCLVTAALWALSRGSARAAGVLLGASLMCGLYAVCHVMAVLLWLGLRHREAARLAILGLAAILVPTFLLLVAMFGEEFIAQTIAYHALKSADPTRSRGSIIAAMLTWNADLLVPAMALGAWRDARMLPVALCAAFALFGVAAYASIHEFYFGLIAPFAAALAAAGMVKAVRWLPLSSHGRPVLVMTVVLAAGGHNYLRASASVEINAVPQAPGIAAMLDELAPRDAPLFGDPEVVPLLSILSGRPVEGNTADTNAKIYTTGVVDLAAASRRLGPGWAGVLIVRERATPDGRTVHYGPMTQAWFADFARTEFRPVRVLSHARIPGETLLLLRRTDVLGSDVR